MRWGKKSKTNPKIPAIRGRVRMWYVLCGTKGKEIESCWLSKVNNTAGTAEIVQVIDGKLVEGRIDTKNLFFTRQLAYQDWLYRSNHETTITADALKEAGERLIEQSETVRAELRPADDWRDL